MLPWKTILRPWAWLLLLVVLIVFASPFTNSPVTAMRAQQAAFLLVLTLMGMSTILVKCFTPETPVPVCRQMQVDASFVPHSDSPTAPQRC